MLGAVGVVVFIIFVLWYMFGRGLNEADKLIATQVPTLLSPFNGLLNNVDKQVKLTSDALTSNNYNMTTKAYSGVVADAKNATDASHLAQESLLAAQNIMTQYQALSSKMSDKATKDSYTKDIALKNALVGKAQSAVQQAANDAASAQQNAALASAAIQKIAEQIAAATAEANAKTADEAMLPQIDAVLNAISNLATDMQIQALNARKYALTAQANFKASLLGNVAVDINNTQTASKNAASDMVQVQAKIKSVTTMVGQLNSTRNKAMYQVKLDSFTINGASPSLLTTLQGYMDSAQESAKFTTALSVEADGMISALSAKFQPVATRGGIGGSLRDGVWPLNLGGNPSEYACQQEVLKRWPLTADGNLPVSNNNNQFGFGYTYVPSSGSCYAVIAGADPKHTFNYYDNPTSLSAVKYTANGWVMPGGGYPSIVANVTKGYRGDMNAVYPANRDCSSYCLSEGANCTYFDNQPNSLDNRCAVNSFSLGAPNTLAPSTGAITRLRIDYPKANN